MNLPTVAVTTLVAVLWTVDAVGAERTSGLQSLKPPTDDSYDPGEWLTAKPLPPVEPRDIVATFVVASSDSVEADGADFTCDGADDQEELQAAIDALPADGGRIVLLEGQYSWFDTLAQAPLIESNVQVQGQGGSTTILLRDNITPFHLRNVSGVTIRDLRLSIAAEDSRQAAMSASARRIRRSACTSKATCTPRACT